MEKPSIIVRLIPLVVFPVTFLVCFYLFLGIASFRLSQEQENYTSEIFNLFAEEGQDTSLVLDRLNALEFDECSEENLLAMRQILFESRYVRQIVFYEGDLGVCSTGSGLLDEPIDRPPPDYVSPTDGTEIWLNREFVLTLTDRTVIANILKSGNYSVMIEPMELNSNYTRPYHWEVVIIDGDAFHHVSGFEGVYNPQATDLDSIYYSLTCSENRTEVCFVLSASLLEIIQALPFLGFMVVMVSLVAAFVADVYVRKLLLTKMDITHRVIKGLLNHTFYWNYQPVIELKTGKVVGCELLARFADQYGKEATGSFLTVIRESGQTWSFTEQMIERAMSELEEYEWPENFLVHMNIFPEDLISSDICKLATIRAVRNRPYRFVLEVAESDNLNEEIVQQNLQFLRREGFCIAIDDFGTGFSNIDSLKQLKCHYLKIDHSFVAEMEDTSIKSSLIPYIVGISKQLELDVIAEGVERKEQLDALVKLDVKYGQGWYLGKPGTVEELANKLALGMMHDQEVTGKGLSDLHGH